MSSLLSLGYGALAKLMETPGMRRLVPGRFRLAEIEISPGTGYLERGEFFAPSDAVVSRCQELGADFVFPEPERFPSVGYTLWRDAEVFNSRYFSYLLHDSTVMLTPRRLPGPYRLVFGRNRIVWSSGSKVLVDRGRGPTMSVEAAITLGGRDFTNWYHWLIDALPALHLANRLPSHLRHLPVLVPEQIFRFPSMVEALELFRGGRDLIVVPEWSGVRAKRLLWIDPLEISNTPATLANTTADPRFHLLHREGMESYRDAYIEAFVHKKIRPRRKIFLARDSARRSYNQDEALEVAREFGFEAVYPAQLTLGEQVRLFREASHVMGPSGAGFAGLLFCQPGTSALCWQDTRLRSMTILPDLATLNHSHYWHIFYRSDESGGLFRSNYTIDPQWLRESMQKWLSL